MAMKKNIKFAVILLTTLLILFFLFLKVDIKEFLLNFKKIDVTILILTFMVSAFFNLIIASIKLKWIIRFFNRELSFKNAFLIRSASFPIRAVSPFKLGEFFIAYHLKKRYNLKLSKGIFSVIIDKIFTVVGLSFFILITLFYTKRYFLFWGVIGLFLIFSFYLIFLKSNRKIKAALQYSRMFKFRKIGCVFLISVFLQLSEIITSLLLLKALGISIPLLALTLYIPLSILISSIPITQFGLGTREAAIIFFFSQYASNELLLTFGLLLSFVEFIFPSMMGLIFVNKILKRTFTAKKNRIVKSQG